MTNRLADIDPNNRLEGIDPDTIVFRSSTSVLDPPIADPNDIDLKTKNIFDISQDTKLPLVYAEEINDSLAGEKYEKPGLIKRGIFGFVNKAFVQPFKNIQKYSTLGEIDVQMEALAEIRRRKEEDGNEVNSEEIPQIFEKARATVDQRVQAQLPQLQAPPPETVPEKAVEIVSGVGAFITKLAIARKFVGGSGMGSEIAAFEAVNIADNGTPGTGILLASTLGLVGRIPAATTIGKVGKVAGQGGVLAGLTAAEGGRPEDIAVAFFLPAIMRTINQFPHLVRGKTFERTIAKDVQAKGFTVKDAKSVAKSVKDAVEVQHGRMTPKAWGSKHGKTLNKIRNKYNKAVDEINKRTAPKEVKALAEQTDVPIDVAKRALKIASNESVAQADKFISAAKILGLEGAEEALKAQPKVDLKTVEHPSHIEIESIEAIPTGTGAGTKALQDLIDKSEKPIRLTVAKTNERARALYERLGFKEITPEDKRITGIRMEYAPKSEAAKQAEPLEEMAKKANERFASLIGKRVTDGGIEWELSRFNQDGIPYFHKVVKGKVQKKEFTIHGYDRNWALEQITPEAQPTQEPPIVGVTGEEYKKAGEKVDGRIVRKDVPNTESISASLGDEWVELPGIREVPISDFGLTGKHYSVQGTNRIKELAEEIKESGEINPLIVVVEKDGPYILEGATRAEALYALGAKSFPALVIQDTSETTGIQPTQEGKVEVQKAEPITKEEKNQLRDLGYTVSEILQMDRQDARDLISGSNNANAHTEEPEAISEDVDAEIQQVRSRRKEAGFARIPAISDFQEISDKLKQNIQKLKSPDLDVISSAYGAVEKWRAETNKAGLYTDWSMRSLREVGATDEQLKLIDDFREDKSLQKDFDALPEEIKQMYDAIFKDFDDMHALAKEEGVLESFIENYTPHLYKDNPKKLRQVLYPQGGKLGTKFRFAKQRKIKSKEEARKLGLHPIDDPITKNAVYKYQLFKTLANKNLIETLKKLKREDGMPLIMGRPKKADKLAVWNNEYQWVNVDALKRFMFVGEAADAPMLIKLNAKAEPEVAKLLNDVFHPWTPKPAWYKAYLKLKGRIKRVVMYNPLIHSWNIWSDTLDEVNFNPYSVVKVQKRGKELYNHQDEIVEYAVDSGLNINMGFSVAKDIRKALGEAPVVSKFLKPLSKLEEWSDKHLWEGVVRHHQLGLFEIMTEHLARKHPEWSREKVGQTASTYINTLYGTLPHTWFTKALHESTSIALFARNWTVSNLDMMTKAVTLGNKGLGTKNLSPDQKFEIGTGYAKHIFKGLLGLVAISNIAQALTLLVTNKLKRDGIIDGEEVPLHSTFQNEKPRHWIDIDTGLTNNKGQRIYVVGPLFRYIRDYIGWTTTPARTAYNKLEPLLKQSIEQIANYSKWREKNIVPKGAPTWDAIKLRARYFIEGVTPIVQFSGREGDVRTLPEVFIPFTGTWIRRGAPGGKFTGLIFDFRSEKKYEKSEIDQKIDEHLQRKDLDSFINEIINTERYSDTEAAYMRVLQNIAPLNYYWDTMSKKEQDEFVLWLEEKGHNRDELIDALEQEVNTLASRDD